jgi:uncharacterized protein DUF2281
MNEFVRKRIERKLDALPDERVYEVLDFIEFLEGRYGQKTAEPTAFQKLAETVEDTLRAGRVGTTTIKTTMDAMSAAGRVMGGISAAGKAVLDQVTSAAEAERPDRKAAPPPTPHEGDSEPPQGGPPA